MYSTETALLRVQNNPLMQANAGECSVLVLLDLSAAFDTLDHHILIERLRQRVGISGSQLDWLSSYLSNRTFSVTDNHAKLAESLFCSVPQGSVLGQILITLYSLPFGQLINKFKGIFFHCYSDNIQFYISFKPQHVSKLSVLIYYISASAPEGIVDEKFWHVFLHCQTCLK